MSMLVLFFPALLIFGQFTFTAFALVLNFVLCAHKACAASTVCCCLHIYHNCADFYDLCIILLLSTNKWIQVMLFCRKFEHCLNFAFSVLIIWKQLHLCFFLRFVTISANCWPALCFCHFSFLTFT